MIGESPGTPRTRDGRRVGSSERKKRRNLLYAKARGYTRVRFIAGVAWPEQIDYCDELGLMVYEENLAAWCLADSPEMKRRFRPVVGHRDLPYCSPMQYNVSSPRMKRSPPSQTGEA